MTQQLCMHCYISGKVQGVWFRASAKREADKLHINGWARNLIDGRVEVFACGTKEHLEQFYIWLQRGPLLARVDSHTRKDLPWEEHSEFNTL
ncbi:acylphosphatase [uncultured Legionella sp.]|uniref:acylphosphatase n=1 Tax=uncultured Legionella sp. TaxID=210934 RepID=UPI002602D48F|nr:acylphosphatase [uncultured Legionella sp.]